MRSPGCGLRHRYWFQWTGTWYRSNVVLQLLEIDHPGGEILGKRVVDCVIHIHREHAIGPLGVAAAGFHLQWKIVEGIDAVVQTVNKFLRCCSSSNGN
jgi:hypothetical protein